MIGIANRQYDFAIAIVQRLAVYNVQGDPIRHIACTLGIVRAIWGCQFGPKPPIRYSPFLEPPLGAHATQ